MDPTIAALLREREHYQRRNLPDRAAAVTAELVRLGHEHAAAPPVEFESTAISAPPENTANPRPRKRDAHAPQ